MVAAVLTAVALAAPAAACRTNRHGVAIVNLDNREHRSILRHAWAAQRRGEPEVLHIDRDAADRNRRASLAGVPRWSELPRRERLEIDPDHPDARHDRDEYPTAGSAEGGANGPADSPRGRLADVAYVRSGENRSAGAVLGARLADCPEGQPWRYERKPGPKT